MRKLHCYTFIHKERVSVPISGKGMRTVTVFTLQRDDKKVVKVSVGRFNKLLREHRLNGYASLVWK